VIYTVDSIETAAIASRDLTFISVQPGVGDGQLVTTLDENNVPQYFFVGSNGEVIQIFDASVGDTYDGIPVSLMRPFWANTVEQSL
jgi:hypothetical protein